MTTCCAMPLAVIGICFIAAAAWFNREFVVNTLTDVAKKYLDEAGLALREK